MSEFDSAWFKFDRAYLHLQRLLTETQQYAEDGPGIEPAVRFDFVTDELVVSAAKVPDPPVSLALTLGDALSCCRQALDHVAWAMVKRGSQPSFTNVHFVIEDNQTSFANSMQSKMPGVIQGDYDVVSDLHTNGIWSHTLPTESALSRMRTLNNREKHRTVQLMASVPSAVGVKGTFTNCTQNAQPQTVVVPGQPLVAGSDLVRIQVNPTGGSPTLEITDLAVETVATIDGVSVEDLINPVLHDILRQVLEKVEPTPPAGLQALGQSLSGFSSSGAP